MGHIQIYNHHIRLPYVVLAVLEFIILLACACLSLSISGSEIEISDAQSIQYGLVFAFVMSLSTSAMGVYSAGLREGFGGVVMRSVVSYCLIGALAMAVLINIFPALSVARGTLFTAVTLSLAFVLILRWVSCCLADVAMLKKRILILGAGHKAKALLDSVTLEGGIGSEIVGFIPSTDASEVDQQWLVNPAGGIKRLVDKYRVDEIVVALDERRRDKGSFFPIEELLDCKLAGTQILELVEFYERELYRIELTEINTTWIVFSGQFRYSRVRDISKRLFDLLVSILLLALAWPFMLLTAAAVYAETGSPILYSQTRVGYKGRLFKINKFRSMSQDAERDGKAVWAKKNDNRITRVGAFIRNTRLDELPQILNVIKGEMSFVGPRPERPEFVDELIKELPFYDKRHRVKPGLMGWAQLKYSYGASVDDAAKKLVYDLYYVKNHSLLLDVLILVQSVEVILLGKGVR